jgi:Uncharacterized integral membrane protein
VILLFHAVGTAMELFKTATGSWTYPEPSLLRLGGVPLFSGFMYGSIGSYIARAWRLFDFRFIRHPPLRATLALAAAIYLNFFADHYLPDARVLLFCRGGVAVRAVPAALPHPPPAPADAVAAGFSHWWRCSSGWPRTSARSAGRGCIPPSATAGSGCRRASSGPGCC